MQCHSSTFQLVFLVLPFRVHPCIANHQNVIIRYHWINLTLQFPPPRTFNSNVCVRYIHYFATVYDTYAHMYLCVMKGAREKFTGS